MSTIVKLIVKRYFSSLDVSPSSHYCLSFKQHQKEQKQQQSAFLIFLYIDTLLSHFFILTSRPPIQTII